MTAAARRRVRQPVVAARVRARRPRGARRRARAARPGDRRRRRARSCSRAAGPRRATSRSRAPRGRASRAGHRIVTTPVEHHAVGHALAYLEQVRVRDRRRSRSTATGGSTPADVEAAITDRTILVSVMLANNEVGTIQPVAEVARRRAGAPRRPAPRRRRPGRAVGRRSTCRGAGRGPRRAGRAQGRGPEGDRARCGSAGHAPPRPAARRRRRSGTGGPGTENVAGAVGMARAFELAAAERTVTVAAGAGAARPARRGRARRSRASSSPATPSSACRTSCRSSCAAVDGASATVALDLEGIAASTGSACTSGSTEPSHVLAAMGYPADEARGAVRLSASAGRRPTPRSTRPSGSCPPCCAGCASRRGRRRDRREAVAADEPDPRRHVRRRRQLGRGGAAPRAGPRGRRRVDAPPRRRGLVLGVPPELLHRGRRRRRAPGRRAARHPVLRHEPRARVRRPASSSRSSPRTSTAGRPARASTATPS